MKETKLSQRIWLSIYILLSLVLCTIIGWGLVLKIIAVIFSVGIIFGMILYLNYLDFQKGEKGYENTKFIDIFKEAISKIKEDINNNNVKGYHWILFVVLIIAVLFGESVINFLLN